MCSLFQIVHSKGGSVHRQFVMNEVSFGWWWVDTLIEWNRDRTVGTNVIDLEYVTLFSNREEFFVSPCDLLLWKSFYDIYYCLGACPIFRFFKLFDLSSPIIHDSWWFLRVPKQKYYIMSLYLFSARVQITLTRGRKNDCSQWCVWRQDTIAKR